MNFRCVGKVEVGLFCLRKKNQNEKKMKFITLQWLHYPNINQFKIGDGALANLNVIKHTYVIQIHYLSDMSYTMYLLWG